MSVRFIFSVFVVLFLLCFGVIAFGAEAQANSTINIRSTPSTNAKILGVFPKGFNAQVLSSSGEWVKISFQGIVGYVKSSYIKITKENNKKSNVSNKSNQTKSLIVATVLKDNARLRSDMSTSSKIVANLSYDTKVYVLQNERNGWVKVKTADGKIGYMASYLLKQSGQKSGLTLLSSRGEVDRTYDLSTQSLLLAEEILSFARRYLGTRYVYGGSSPAIGFDCSGFVQYVFKNFGIQLERTAASMAASNGVRVSYTNLKPGDLLFFDTDGGRNYINHVGIYLGDGRYIHASSARGCVTISDLASKYGTSFMMAKRVLR